MRRALLVVVVLALVVQPAAVPIVSAADDSTIERTTTLSLTPSDPGSVDAEVSFHVPPNVNSITTSIPEDATVIETNGFEQTSEHEYRWDGNGPDPSLTMHVPANRTGAGLREPVPEAELEMGEGYEFVDTGPWAIVSAPAMSTGWSYDPEDGKPTFESTLAVAGEGVAGKRMAYLGPSTSYERSAHGQTFTLVVPDAATLGPEAEAILDSLEAASVSLRVDERDPEVTVFAAPTGVEWAAQGIAGDADAWVQADLPLDDPNNVWLHEYVHTRSNFTTTTDARWITEGSAEYYAARLTLDQGLIGFDEFASHLERGARSPYGSSVLSEPDTWARGANYLKGALVFGTLDYRIRTASDSTHSTDDLLKRMNEREDPVSHAFLREEVTEFGGSSTADALDRYATTEDVPSMWDRGDHTDAFATLPPRIVVQSIDSYDISGPYRNQTSGTLPTVVPGEQVTITATIGNDGDATGSYEIPFVVDGETRRTVSGSLDAGETRTIDLNATVDSVGTHEYRFGELSGNVTVEEPAEARLTDVSISEQTVRTGAEVTVTMTATNDADTPATAEIPIDLDGETVARWSPTLDVGETETTTRSVTIQDPGQHVVRIGSSSFDVTAEGESRTTVTTTQETGTEQTTATETPGFTALIGVISVLLSLVFALTRR